MPTPSPQPGPPGGWGLVLLVLVSALPVLLATRPLLLRLPEPAEPDRKVAYRDLPTPRFVVGCTVLSGIGAVLVALTLPVAVWPLWWVLAAPALVLVAVDARTTWLPLPLTRVVWVAATGAAAVATWLGGTVVLGRAAAGAVAAGVLYLVLWRLSGRGIGFGDVRLAPVLGAAGAAAGWSTLLATLLLGSLVGALVGLLLAARRQHGPFAYAPSMLAGAFLASAARTLSG